MRRLFSLAFLLLFSLPAAAAEWSLQDRSKGWNSRELVSLYFHNSELQTQWAWAALSHYSFRGDERVLDFGAGDGKLSALISFMVPKGSVQGVDISEEMTSFASKMFPSDPYKNLAFLPVGDLDFAELSFPEKFDLVTAFCVFHLVPHPISVLKNIKRQMDPKGQLVATFPIGGNPEFFQAAVDEMAKRGWNFPAATEGVVAMRDPAKARQIFEAAGFDLSHFEVVGSRTPFSSKEEMADWFEGTLAANWDIPVEGRRGFFIDLVDRYLAYRPQDKEDDGFVYFSLYRIDLIASPFEVQE